VAFYFQTTSSTPRIGVGLVLEFNSEIQMQFPIVHKWKWEQLFPSSRFPLCASGIFERRLSLKANRSIEGTVTDSSGGAIPGVTVRSKNLETGATRANRHRRFPALLGAPFQLASTKSPERPFAAELRNGISLSSTSANPST